MNVSASSATVEQGATTPGIQISVQPVNGFAGDVQITVSGLPSGVSTSPQSPFTVPSGGVSLLFSASVNATVGLASISLQAASGSLSHTKSISLTVQGIVASKQVFAKAGFYKFILYDQKRQWLYLSNIDHLDVFDLQSTTFRSGILPPGGPPPNALIRQAMLTPDGSQLAIADFGVQSVYLIDPDTAAGINVSVAGVPGDANSGPVRLAATSTKTVFVGLVGDTSGASACSVCLQQMDLQTSPVSVATAPRPLASALTGAPLLDAGADGTAVFLSFPASAGQPVAGWNAATPGQFLTANANFVATNIGVAAHGTFFALGNSATIEIREANLELQSTIAVST